MKINLCTLVWAFDQINRIQDVDETEIRLSWAGHEFKLMKRRGYGNPLFSSVEFPEVFFPIHAPMTYQKSLEKGIGGYVFDIHLTSLVQLFYILKQLGIYKGDELIFEKNPKNKFIVPRGDSFIIPSENILENSNRRENRIWLSNKFMKLYDPFKDLMKALLDQLFLEISDNNVEIDNVAQNRLLPEEFASEDLTFEDFMNDEDLLEIYSNERVNTPTPESVLKSEISGYERAWRKNKPYDPEYFMSNYYPFTDLDEYFDAILPEDEKESQKDFLKNRDEVLLWELLKNSFEDYRKDTGITPTEDYSYSDNRAFAVHFKNYAIRALNDLGGNFSYDPKYEMPKNI